MTANTEITSFDATRRVSADRRARLPRFTLTESRLLVQMAFNVGSASEAASLGRGDPDYGLVKVLMVCWQVGPL